MRNLSIIILIYGLMSAIMIYGHSYSYVPVEDLDNEVYSIINESANIVKKKYDIHVCGTVVAMPSNIVKKIGIDFEVKGARSKEDLKNILSYAAEILKEKVNNSILIRKHLANYPFEVKNIQVTIFIATEDGQNLFHPDICIASLRFGKFKFRTDDPEKKYTYKTDEEEDYVNCSQE